MNHVLPASAMPSVPVEGGSRPEACAVRRLYCVGRKHVEPAIEMGFTGREPPFFFREPADTALPMAEGTGGSMHFPRATHCLHHEVERVVVIGKAGHNIPAARAMEHGWGYGVGSPQVRITAA